MKKTFLILACLLVLFAAVSCSAKKDAEAAPAAAWEPTTTTEKYYYAFGYYLGENYKGAASDFDFKAVAEGIKAAGDGSFKYSDEELQKIIAEYQSMMQKQEEEQTAANLKRAEEFLAKNKTAEGVQTTSTGLQYKVLEPGDGANPTADSVVTVDYDLYDIDMNLIESTATAGQPASFSLSNVIPGFSEGLQMMKVGEKCRLIVSPDLGYGSQSTPMVPGNSLLIFDVTLRSIN